MVRFFIGTLKGLAFDWFRSLPPGTINSWIDLETWFLSRFYEDDTEVTMDKLLSNRNNNDTWRNYNEKEHNDDEKPKTKKSKESSSIDAEVLKGIQAQMAAQRDELKKAGMVHPYPLE